MGLSPQLYPTGAGASYGLAHGVAGHAPEPAGAIEHPQRNQEHLTGVHAQFVATRACQTHLDVGVAALTHSRGFVELFPVFKRRQLQVGKKQKSCVKAVLILLVLRTVLKRR